MQHLFIYLVFRATVANILNFLLDQMHAFAVEILQAL